MCPNVWLVVCVYFRGMFYPLSTRHCIGWMFWWRWWIRITVLGFHRGKESHQAPVQFKPIQALCSCKKTTRAVFNLKHPCVASWTYMEPVYKDSHEGADVSDRNMLHHATSLALFRWIVFFVVRWHHSGGTKKCWCERGVVAQRCLRVRGIKLHW